jgi:uncharacterized protein
MPRGVSKVLSDENSAPLATLGPVRQRIVLLDVLRGLAILGILFINISAFAGWVFLDPQRAAALPDSSGDLPLNGVLEALIEGKFYSLFSLLFGVGFVVMVQRFESRGANPVPLLARRFGALFVIGVLNAAFIFHGDILMLYGLLGFLLLLFRRRSVRALTIWAVALLLMPVVLYGTGLALLPNGGGPFPPPAAVLNAFEAFKSADYVRIVIGNIALDNFNWLRRLVLMFYPRVFAMFLLGLALGKMGVFQETSRHSGLLRTFSLSGLLIGLPASILFAALDRHESWLPLTANGFARAICESVGTPLLCLGYVAWIALLFENTAWRRALLWLAPVGRTALSNYLLQGVVCTFLFYGIGAGLFMRVGLATSELIAVALFAAQVVVSRLWLTRFRYGPVEWIWRQLTYWKWVPIRRAPYPGR